MTINPKLAALAKKIDAANECARRVEAAQKDCDDSTIRAAEELCAEAYAEIAKLEFKLAKIPATNIEELALKARYARVESYNQTEWPGCGGQAIAAAVISELRALGGEGNSPCAEYPN